MWKLLETDFKIYLIFELCFIYVYAVLRMGHIIGTSKLFKLVHMIKFE